MVLVMLLLLAFCKTVFSAEQETILGIQGKGFVLLGADRSFARSIVVMKQNFSKMRALDQNKILAVSGDQSSAEVFSQIIQRNLCLEEQESGTPISTEAAARFARNEIAQALRKNPFGVSCLLGGVDIPGNGDQIDGKCTTARPRPSLFWIDQYGSLHRLSYGAHGYASNFLLSLLDREVIDEDMDIKTAIEIAKKCFLQLRKRYIINTSSGLEIMVVTEAGVQRYGDVIGNTERGDNDLQTIQ